MAANQIQIQERERGEYLKIKRNEIEFSASHETKCIFAPCPDQPSTAHTHTGAWHEAGATLKCPTDTHDMLIKRPQTADGDGLTDS